MSGFERGSSLVQASSYSLKIEYYRDVAQLGSVPPWGGGGRRFKSCRSDHLKQKRMSKGVLFFVESLALVICNII